MIRAMGLSSLVADGRGGGQPARGRGQAAVLLDANDLPGRLAHQGCAVVDPDYAVVLGQLGHAGALLLAELYGFHVLSLIVGWSTAPFGSVDPRFRFCFVQARDRSTTTSASTAPKVSGSAPLPTASSGRSVSCAPCKAR